MDDLKIIFYLAVALAWLIMRNYRKVQRHRPEISETPPPPEPVPVVETLKSQRAAGKPRKSLRSALMKPVASRPRGRDLFAGENNPELDAVKAEAQRVIDFFDRTGMGSADPSAESESVRHAGILPPFRFDLKTAVIHAEILRRPEF